VGSPSFGLLFQEIYGHIVNMAKLVTLNVCTSCRVAGSICELKMIGLVLSFIKHSIIDYKNPIKTEFWC
jgi:type III secretory pathway component EscU